MKTKLHFIAILFILNSFGARAQSLENKFEKMLDSIYNANQDALGILVHVESPENNISWTASVGFSDSSKTTLLLSEQPILIASNTKTYVSAAILRLAEDNLIKPDQPIRKLLSKNTCKALEKAEYHLDKITIRNLLSHTSGIHDYVNDEYFQLVIANPQKQWSRNEQIMRAVNIGKPLGEPGIKFSYGDINYLLLTEIIETLTKKPFNIAIKELLKFDEINLHKTWFKGIDQSPKNILPFAHQYAKNYKWDSYNINPSWDLYGGGGIATTVKESALFFQNLFEGNIIKNKDVLKEMYTYVLPPKESKYCLGLYHFDFGYNLYYHGGWWGTDVNYSPETNSSVSVFTLVKEKRGVVNPYLGKRIQEMIK